MAIFGLVGGGLGISLCPVWIRHCHVGLQGDGDMISSYHIYASCFFRLDVGQTLNVC